MVILSKDGKQVENVKLGESPDMVIPGRVGVQDFSCFSISMVRFARMEKTDDRVDWRQSGKRKVSGNVFTLGHIKFESPRGLTRKMWINTFEVEIDDFTQKKHMI